MAKKIKKQQLHLTKDEAKALAKFIKSTKANSDGYYLTWDYGSGIGINLGIRSVGKDGSPGVVQDITDYACW